MVSEGSEEFEFELKKGKFASWEALGRFTSIKTGQVGISEVFCATTFV